MNRFGGAEKPNPIRSDGSGSGIRYDKGEPGWVERERAKTARPASMMMICPTDRRRCSKCLQFKSSKSGTIRQTMTEKGRGTLFLCSECR